MRTIVALIVVIIMVTIVVIIKKKEGLMGGLHPWMNNDMDRFLSRPRKKWKNIISSYHGSRSVGDYN